MQHLSPRTEFLVLCIAFVSISCANQSDRIVIGCGGFVRWNPALPSTPRIEYDRIKINLLSEATGALTEVTDVLPNGAFSVPVYYLGTYRITLSSPTGWVFNPIDGHLVDLQTDLKACSKDFNFMLDGYTLFGQVLTYGLLSGPSGLLVQLLTLDSQRVVQHNSTQHNGHFLLAPVLPGTYELFISEAGSGHTRARVNVTVDTDSVTFSQPIILMGHFIRGALVDFEEQPLSGSRVYLASNISSFEMSKFECHRDDVPPKLVTILLDQLMVNSELLCQSTTNAEGKFSFDGLPAGEYFLVPYHATHSASEFSFSPPFVRVTMSHKDISLDTPSFRPEGLQILPGRLSWPDGEPITSAKVYTTHGATRVSHPNKDGFYQLGFLIPGPVTILVESEGAQFLPHEFHLSVDSERLPDLQPYKLSVCGRIQLSDAIGNSLDKGKVFVQDKSCGKDVAEVTLTEADTGHFRFCTDLVQGYYEFRPDLTFRDSPIRSVHLVPPTIQLNLRSGPVSDLMFSQFRAHLSGRLLCLASHCTASNIRQKLSFVVRLESVDSNAALSTNEVQFSKNDNRTGHFSFENVLPGDYHLQLMSYSQSGDMEPLDGWCWKPLDSMNLEQPANVSADFTRLVHVRHADLDWTQDAVLDFVQIGYTIPIQIHSLFHLNRLPTVSLRARTSREKPEEWNLVSRTSKVCLSSLTDTYLFDVSTCLDVSSPKPAQIAPASDCHHRLDLNPVIILTVIKVPIFIQLTFKNDLSEEERKTLTKNQIIVDVHYDNQNRAPETVITNWSSDTQPVAEGIVWLMANQSITLKPRESRGIRRHWHYTYVIHEPKYLHVSPLTVTEAFGDSQSYPLVLQSREGAQLNDDHCRGLFDGQLVQFGLDVGVMLRGQIQPPVPKVEVELFERAKLIEVSVPQIQQPLLPFQLADVVNSTATTTRDEVTSSSSPVATTLSDPQGIFMFGPVRLATADSKGPTGLANPRHLFSVRLCKPGYEFMETAVDSTRQSSINWLFKASKSSLVEVLVQEKPINGSKLIPLQGVLVSVIGESHRGTMFTDHSGVANFVGLAPGQYYIRAMMKEYMFTVRIPKPDVNGQASPVVVKEGLSVGVEILAKRISFSSSGVVKSLGGAPLANVSVEAQWIFALPSQAKLRKTSVFSDIACELRADDMANIPREQGWTDANGVFRIRGLFPGCFYSISVLTSPTASDTVSCPQDNPSVTSTSIRHTVPSVVYIKQPNQDSDGLAFIAVPQMFMSVISVNVDTEDRFLPHLHLTVFRLDRPEQVLVKHDFSDSLLFRVPGSKMCQILGRDVVIRLESSLDPQVFTNLGPQQFVIRPKIDVDEHHTFVFLPKLRPSVQNSFRSEL